MEFVLAFFLNTLGCESMPTYCQIKKNNPHLSNEYAFRISKTINKVSKKYDIPQKIFTAILMQESSYRIGIINNNSPHKDFGIAQINYKTANDYGFNILRLINDLEYSIEAGAKVLSWFKRKYSKKEKDWYVRYNCGTRRSIKIKKCQDYKNKITKYL